MEIIMSLHDSKTAANSEPSEMKELRIFTEEGIDVPYERITYEEIQRDPVLREKCKKAMALIESFKLEHKPESSDESAHNHLTYEEMKRFSAIDFNGDLNDADSDFVQYIDDKVDDCSVCRQRYMVFNTIGDMLPGLHN